MTHRLVDTSYQHRAHTWCAGGCVVILAAALGLWLGWPRSAEPAPPPGSPLAASGSVVAPVIAATPPRQVRLEIVSDPSGAQVFVDGVYVGRTPAQRVPVWPNADGHVELELRHDTLDTPVTRKLELASDIQHGRVELELHP